MQGIYHPLVNPHGITLQGWRAKLPSLAEQDSEFTTDLAVFLDNERGHSKRVSSTEEAIRIAKSIAQLTNFLGRSL